MWRVVFTTRQWVRVSEPKKVSLQGNMKVSDMVYGLGVSMARVDGCRQTDRQTGG